jgi:CHAT domain-containing protein
MYPITRLLVGLFFISLFFTFNLAAQTEITTLEAGKPLERQMAGGETHNYRIPLSSGQFLNLYVNQNLIDVVVTAFAPDGSKIIEKDGFTGNRGFERIWLIADKAGDYRIEVKSLEKDVPAGIYEIKIVELRASNEKDVSNVAALNLLAEAAWLYQQVEDKLVENTEETLKKSLAKYEQSLLLFRAAGNLDGESSALFESGNVSAALGNQAPAINYWEQFVAFNEKRGKPVIATNGLMNMALFYWSLGDYTKAIETYQKAFLIFEKAGVKSGMVQTLTNVGNIYSDGMGDFNEALEYFKKAVALAEQLNDPEELTAPYSGIGTIYSQLGNYSKAFEYDNKALALCERSGDKRCIANLRMNIGDNYGHVGNFELAIDYFQKSFDGFKELKRNNGQATALLNLGEVYGDQGRYEDALKNLNKALAMFEQSGYQPRIGTCLTRLGMVYRQQKDYDRSLEYLNRALELRKTLKNKADISEILNEIALAHLLKGNFTQTLDFARQAAEIAEKNSDPETFWNSKLNLGKAYLGLKETAKAQQAFNEAVATIENLRSQVADEQAQESFFGTRTAPFYELVKLYADQNDSLSAFNYAERAKSRTLLDVLRNGRTDINKTMTAEEQKQERRLKSELVSINAQISREGESDKRDAARVSDLQKQLEKKRLEFEDFQMRLNTAHPELKIQRGEMKPVSLAESANDLLPDNKSALLEYVVADNKAFLFVLTRDTSQKISLKVYPIEIKGNDLAERTESFRAKLAKGDLDFSKQAQDLYDLLLKPAEIQLKNKTNLIIVPDSALWDLPFQALQPAQGKYLIETAAISYAPSLTALREMAKKNKGKNFTDATLLAFGNPTIGKETSEQVKQVFMGETLEPLPEAERLVNGLGKLYGAGRSKIFVGAEAQEETAKTESPKYRIVQFAAHGILNDVSPMYSHIVLSQKENNSSEDGLLEAWEMKDLNLNAEMVVLSACETARGKIGSGEGVIGMSWALFIAGAPTTVATQWKVESSSTTELMLEFHRQLLTGKNITKAEALRRASLKLLKMPQYKHPSYWAGFVMVGDGF